MNPVIENILSLFSTWGGESYSELVSQTAHAEQCAALAVASGADDELVIASLLHDLGHLLVLEAASGTPQLDSDDEHEATGARHVAHLFGPRVAAPIALHVAAKRYLCAVDPGYHDTLSPASVASLRMQGGPMTTAEVLRFERLPHFSAAVSLRRWDDEAKIADLEVDPFEKYLPVMERLAANAPQR
jgi:phosphonate degradation associated HDIG domain protein